MEADGDVVGEGLVLFVGGGKSQDDHFVGQVLLTGCVNWVEDVGRAKATVAIGGPKQGLITHGIGCQLNGLLANVLVGTSVAGEGDVFHGEEYLVNPGMVAAARASGVLFIDPAERVLALGHGEEHLAP